MNVEARDVKKIEICAAAINAEVDSPGFSEAVVAAMTGFLPTDVAAFIEIGDLRQRVVALGAGEQLPAERLHALERHLWAHPLLSKLRRGPSCLPIRISEHPTRTEFHRTPLYDQFFRPLGLEHEIVLGILRPYGHQICRTNVA